MTAQEIRVEIERITAAVKRHEWTPEVFERTEAILYYQGGDIFNTLRRELLPEEYEAFDRAFCNHFRPDLTELADWIGRKRKGDAITRVMGSTDIMGICRSYIALGNVPGEEDIKYMSHEKSSLERKGKTILFEIDPDRGGIVYVGENALSMDDYTAIRNKKRAKDAPALEGAKQFIIDQMPDGSRLASEIVTLAKARHISERSLRRAREELQIIVQKTKEFPPKSLWVLPEKAGQPEEPQAVQETLPL